jgi:hypothetical protein
MGMWQMSGPNTAKMLRDNPNCLPLWGEGIYRPTPTGRMYFDHMPAGKSRSSYKPNEYAHVIFLQFVVNPDCEKRQPRGPCACGCGQYFLKTSRHPKIYCKGHGSRVSAKAAMKRMQAEKRKPRVKAAQRAIRRFEQQRRRGDWKKWISADTGIALRTLEGWAKNDFIQAPTKKGNKA